MQVNEARRDDLAAGIEHLVCARLDARSNLADYDTLHQHVHRAVQPVLGRNHPPASYQQRGHLGSPPSANGFTALGSMYRGEYSIGSKAVMLSPFTLHGAGSSHVILSPIRFAHSSTSLTVPERSRREGRLFDCHSDPAAAGEESLRFRSG